MNDVALPRARTQSPSPRRRARWLRVALALLLAFLVVCLSMLLGWLGGAQGAPLEITVNGTPLISGADLARLPEGYRFVLAFALAVVTLFALLAAGATLIAAVLLLVPALLLTVALPVLLGTLAALVVLSPLLLLGWLLWRAARPGSPRMQAP
ncbi:MAG TPA: hypothetical protein VLE94_10410 [Burkholderiaceae bacterium]|nr:hypothetical protein [Burkholderiaceae bacterium]